ncbi:outer membrane protein assembly factor BamB family protein [Lignipirellula cremea]|uniref:PQQ enzyme repeat protein n=1 Tax=Lignipirellula cremea TaxID=2528010 RepID=A0A518DKN4_9BACT|nr:PQQ-binding-like beta-propeller repeat protein [Lignipirellula cremea]QDU92398.1 PQQ enzyme repeat protein [Lignipirellula cremea]
MRSALTFIRPKAVVQVFTAYLILVVIAPLSAQTVADRESIFAPPDRSIVRMLNSSRELLDEGRNSEALQLLTSVLDAENDFFLVAAQPNNSPAEREYQSVKNEANQILSRMPNAAQAAYELQFGAVAHKLLDDAVSARDIEQIFSVQRRYFHTKAGHEARYLLGNIYWDHGRFGRAANCFQTLLVSRQATRFEPYLSLKLAICWLWTGDATRAEEVLLDLQKRFPEARLKLGGQTVELFQRPDEALEWLRRITGTPRLSVGSRRSDWSMFRHDPARLGRGNGRIGMLRQPIWRQAVSQSFEVELTLQAQREEFYRASTPALPSVLPLAIDKTIVMRTPQRLAAVDIQTGKLIWAADLPDSPSVLASSSQTAKPFSAPSARLAQRMWHDKTFGSLSSDGNAVFALDGFGMLPGPNEDRNGLAGRPYNALSAYKLQSTSGNQIWSINMLGDDPARSERPFFLGSPLPLDGELYCLVEVRDEIRLIVLNPDDGKLLWSQQLALADPKRFDPLLRRTSGISPSFADGILICPTGAGAMVAIDLSTRSLLWAYEYPATQVTQFARPTLDAGASWADSCAVISGRRVVITPAESRQMHCLDLANGSHQWSLDRGDLAFLACVDRGLAIAVGSRQLTAIELKTGKVAADWPLKLPLGSLPSGRGYCADGHYYLPLNVNGEGEVAAIQLDPPAIVHRSQFPSGTIPGNLIFHREQVLSQNVEWLESYYQSQPLQP